MAHYDPNEMAFQRWAPVPGSRDLERVINLPRRAQLDLKSNEAVTLVEYVSAKFRKPPGPCQCMSRFGRKCITRLLPVQAWTLHEITCGVTSDVQPGARYHGIMGAIGVGHGKTMLDLLAAMAMPFCRLAVLLVPPGLVKQLLNDYDMLGAHWWLPNLEVHGGNATQRRTELPPGFPPVPVVHVVPYSMLSQPKSSDWLRLMQPDTIIADEVHLLKDPQSARTRRVLRYFAERGATRFCGWSGSITDDSIENYSHLCALALRYGSPLPLEPDVVADWARAVDPSDDPCDGGALLESLMEANPPFVLGHEDDGGQAGVQIGLNRRLVQTPGFIATSEAAVDVEIVITEKPAPVIPINIQTALAELHATWTRPDGEELIDAMSLASCARQIACGFYYVWEFRNGETETQIKAWLEARKLWNRELRFKLAGGLEHMDSPHLCEVAAQRAWGDRAPRPDRPMWRAEHWPRWRDVKGTVKPFTKAVRLNRYLIDDAANWAHTNRGIVWYESREVGLWLQEVSGLPLHTGGKDAEDRILAEKGDRSIIASTTSHGTGRDGLQYKPWKTQLFFQVASSAVRWEQWLGRLVRNGQDTGVEALFYAHTPELRKSIEEAKLRAKYVQRTLTQNQKLLAGLVRGGDPDL